MPVAWLLSLARCRRYNRLDSELRMTRRGGRHGQASEGALPPFCDGDVDAFSYYGMRAIFVLYLTKALLFDKSFASKIYGSYTGLVYLTPLLGGYVADRYWGNRRSIIVGGALMALGQFCLFLSGTLYQDRDLSIVVMFAGLGLLIFGNGFFKPNISTMVGQLYPANDRRIDAAFTIFYMGINLALFLSPLVCGTLGERYDEAHNPLPEYFRWGFLAACVGMVVSLVFFIVYKNRYIVTPDGQAIGAEPNKARDAGVGEATGSTFAGKQAMIWGGVFLVLGVVLYHFLAFGQNASPLSLFTSPPDFNAIISAVILAAAVAMPGFIIADTSLTHEERDRIWVIYISAFFVIFFWSAFEQAGASLTFFAEEQTERTVDLHIPMLAVHGVSVALAGLLIGLLVWGRRRLRDEPVSLSAILFALIAAGLGYIVYQNAVWLHAGKSGLTIEDVPASYFQSINAIAIVMFAPFFSSLWTRLGSRNIEPPSIVKQAIGLALLAIGFLVIALRHARSQPGHQGQHVLADRPVRDPHLGRTVPIADRPGDGGQAVAGAVCLAVDGCLVPGQRDGQHLCRPVERPLSALGQRVSGSRQAWHRSAGHPPWGNDRHARAAQDARTDRCPGLLPPFVRHRDSRPVSVLHDLRGFCGHRIGCAAPGLPATDPDDARHSLNSTHRGDLWANCDIRRDCTSSSSPRCGSGSASIR